MTSGGGVSHPTPDGPDKILHHPVQHQQIILTVRFIRPFPGLSECAHTRMEDDIGEVEEEEKGERN